MLISLRSVVASVEALQKSLTSGRLLLLLDSVSGISDTPHSKRTKNKSSCGVGSVVHAEVLTPYFLMSFYFYSTSELEVQY